MKKVWDIVYIYLFVWYVIVDQRAMSLCVWQFIVRPNTSESFSHNILFIYFLTTKWFVTSLVNKFLNVCCVYKFCLLFTSSQVFPYEKRSWSWIWKLNYEEFISLRNGFQLDSVIQHMFFLPLKFRYLAKANHTPELTMNNSCNT